MSPARLHGLVVLLSLASLSTVGCHARCKQQLSKLKGKFDELRAQKMTLQARLSGSDGAENTMRAQLAAARREQIGSKAKVKQLENQLAKARTAASTARGGVRVSAGETRLYETELSSDVLFAPGRASLTAAGKKALSSIVATLNRSYSGRIVRVYGHTDGDPIRKSKKLWHDNLDLSANRAMSVARYLIANGVKAANVETVAMGETRPVASNKTKAGKARNRRVEIIVIQK